MKLKAGRSSIRGKRAYIPYGRQQIDEEDIREVVRVLLSDYLTTGPKIQEFEEAVAQYTGARYAVAVSSGTAALHIACLAAGIGEGDEIITTPITFAASANCALYCGGRPVFADICPDTYNIDPADIQRKITSRTKALIPVHYTGQPCQMDEIHGIAREHGLVVIEDGAHALGARYRGQRIGGLSDMTCFSFHPVKHITTAEGGMVLTNDEKLYERLRLYRSHGITREEKLLQEDQGPWYYEQLDLGYNYRISDVQCALGISQLKKLPHFLQRRREIARVYDQAFEGQQDIITPYQREECENSYHLYVIQVPAQKRRDIFQKLREDGIGVNVHYIPVYHHPYYQQIGYDGVSCPQAEQLYRGLISLPIHPGLSREEQEYVIECVKRHVSETV